MQGTCDVHRILKIADGNERNVKYCSLCKKYLCDECRNSPVRRAKAFGKTLGRLFGKAA